MTTPSAADLARAMLTAFATGDRAAAERLIAPDFHFTSPYDNAIDRAAYFELCWPNSEAIEGFDIIRLLEGGDSVAVTYVGHAKSGKRFRNTEVLTFREGRLVEVEVYFGWNVPHEVGVGEHGGAS